MMLFCLTGCSLFETTPAPTTIPTLAPTTEPTFTPDPCTGWWCPVTGVVYGETAGLGNGLKGATVTLVQTSYCSPTRGQHQSATGPDGRFELSEVFFHDTDWIRIKVEAEGYASAEWDSVDFYCYYCSCFGSPLEITLRTAPGP